MKLFTVVVLTFLYFGCQGRGGDAGSTDPGSGTFPSSQNTSPEVETVTSGGFEISGTTEVIVDRKVSGAYVIEGVINE